MAESRRGAHVRPSTRSSFRKPSRSELREAMGRTLDPSSRPAAADTAAPSSRPDDAEDPVWQQQSRPAPETEADKAVARAKRRQRRLRDLRSLLLRMAFLLLVVYVLFFHVVGLMIMPNPVLRRVILSSTSASISMSTPVTLLFWKSTLSPKRPHPSAVPLPRLRPAQKEPPRWIR